MGEFYPFVSESKVTLSDDGERIDFCLNLVYNKFTLSNWLKGGAFLSSLSELLLL